MHRATRTCLLAIALIALLALPASAGSEYVVSIEDHRRGKVDETLLQVEGLNLKMGVPKQGRKKPAGAVIFRGDRREGLEPRMIILDDQGGHIIINKAKIEQIAQMIPPNAAPMMNEQMRAAARAQIERIPDPEQRAQAREMFEQRYGSPGASPAASQTEFVERGVREKQGYPCVRYDVMRDGKKVQEIWATDWANLEGGRQTMKAFEAFGEFYRDLRESLEKISGMGGQMLGNDQAFKAIFELGRFPVVTYDYDAEGELIRTSTLTSGAKVDHEPGTFKPGPDSVERQLMQ